MTIQKEKAEGSPANQESIQQTEATQPEKTIPVDIYGETIELPLSKAKLIISKRDEKTQGYKQLQEKVAKAEAQAKQEAERASLLEAMKKSSVEEVEAMASAKYVDKLQKIEAKIVAKEIESALLSSDDFLKESKDDAIKLLRAEHSFKVNEEGDEVVSTDGKKVQDVVKEWLGKKDIFRKAKGATGTGAKVVGGKNPVANLVKTDIAANMSKGLGKIYGG